MVIDGRTELASPDLELARLLLRSGKPVFLAVNKIDTAALAPSAENFRRLGFANVIPISAEHGAGIGDLLDQVFAALASTEPGAPNAEILSESDALSKLRPGGTDKAELGAPSRALRNRRELRWAQKIAPSSLPPNRVPRPSSAWAGLSHQTRVPHSSPQAMSGMNRCRPTQQPATPTSSRTRPALPSSAAPTSASQPCSTCSPARTALSSHPSPGRLATPSTSSSPTTASSSASSTPPASAARARPASWPKSSPSSWPAAISRPPTSRSSCSTPPRASPRSMPTSAATRTSPAAPSSSS